MATAITLDMFLAALDKRKIPYKFYKSKADALRHNRNAQQGWGPIKGLIVHNFASDISDGSSLAYLYNGDSGRKLPGPLSQLAITDDGMLWIIGWGAANHAGPGDYDMDYLIVHDRAPLNADFKPNTSGTSATGTTVLNPHYIGVEMTYGAKGPTAAQRATVVKLGAATMEMLGPGYTGGSIAMHREFTINRSDPQFFTGYEIRKAVNAALKTTTKPEVPPVTTPIPPVKPPVGELPTPPNSGSAEYKMWYWDGVYEPYRKTGSTNPFWTPASYLINIYQQNDKIIANQEKILAALARLEAK